jgi:uncharacterized protein YeaO (DUF488 family)
MVIAYWSTGFGLVCIAKDKARIDLWMKEIAPPEALRKWFGHDPER